MPTCTLREQVRDPACLWLVMQRHIACTLMIYAMSVSWGGELLP